MISSASRRRGNSLKAPCHTRVAAATWKWLFFAGGLAPVAGMSQAPQDATWGGLRRQGLAAYKNEGLCLVQLRAEPSLARLKDGAAGPHSVVNVWLMPEVFMRNSTTCSNSTNGTNSTIEANGTLESQGEANSTNGTTCENVTEANYFANVGILFDRREFPVGKVKSVQLPDLGATVEEQEVAARIVTSTFQYELLSPVAGTVIEVNDEAGDTATLSTYHGNLWLFKVGLSSEYLPPVPILADRKQLGES